MQDDRSLSSQLSVEQQSAGDHQVLQRGESYNSINSIGSQDSKEHKIPRTRMCTFLFFGVCTIRTGLCSSRLSGQLHFCVCCIVTAGYNTCVYKCIGYIWKRYTWKSYCISDLNDWALKRIGFESLLWKTSSYPGPTCTLLFSCRSSTRRQTIPVAAHQVCSAVGTDTNNRQYSVLPRHK